MKKEEKRRILKLLIGIISLVLIVSGFSYASMYVKIESNKGNIIKSACLKVDITDNGNINLQNEMPKTDEEGLKQKAYTYSIHNTCNIDAYYESTINVLATSASNLEQKVKVSLSGDAYLPAIMINNLSQATLLENLSQTARGSYIMDTGYLESGKTKEFKLYTWIDKDVTEFSGELNLKVAVNSYMNQGTEYGINTIGYKLVENNYIYNNPPYFDGETDPYFEWAIEDYMSYYGLYKDSENKEYYFRGAKSALKNNISFAGKNWKIIKINKDGSIKIILNDSIGSSAYATTNTSKNDVSYKNSSIYSLLNTWYNNNLKGYESYIKEDALYCSDTRNINENNQTIYQGYTRNVTNKAPNTACEAGDTTKKIGLITVDEVVQAGGKSETENTMYYLYNNAINGYWTMTPSRFDTQAKVFATSSATKSIYEETTTAVLGVRPVITIKNSVNLNGTGTEQSPYKIGETVNDNDTTAPIIKYTYTTSDYSKDNKNIYIGAEDELNGSGINAYLVSTSSTKPSAGDSNWVEYKSKNYKTTVTYPNGTYYAFVKDKSGNVSTGEKITIDKVQSANPNCSITITPEGAVESKVLTITSTNKLDPIGYSWDGKSYESFNRQIVKKNQVYTAFVKDMSGNIGSCSVTVTEIP